MRYRLCALLLILATLTLAVAQNSTAASPPANNSQQQTMPGASEHGTGLSQRGLERLVKEVRHELVMLPRYGVFDDLSYEVDPDGTVTLMGYVADPTLKSDAENVVKRIEGVEKVNNQIQVLPVSPNDDRLRRALYRAIYGNEVLSQYALRAVPPIHIIVNNGRAILTGVVARQMDKQIAEIQAKSVPGVFSVTDNLQVEEPGK